MDPNTPDERRPSREEGIPDPASLTGDTPGSGSDSLPGPLPSSPPPKARKKRNRRGVNPSHVAPKHTLIPDSEAFQEHRLNSDGVPGARSSKIEIAYEPHPKQALIRAAIEGGAKIIMFRAGIRSGKTFSCARECLDLIYKDKRLPNLGYIVTPTINMGRIPRRLFIEAAGDALVRYKRASDDGPPHALLLAPEGADFKYYLAEFHSGEYPDRMRGASIGWGWIDEAAYTKPEVYDVILGRLLDSGGILLISTSPSSLSHWTETEVAAHAAKCGRCGQFYYDHKWRREGLKLVPNDHEPENVTGDMKIAVIQCTTYDNIHLPEENIRELEARYALKDPIIKRRELYGEPCGFEGLVYRSFTRQEHRSDLSPWQLPKGSYVVAGVDFGVNDPFVVLFVVRADDVWHVLDEYYYTGPPISIAEHVRTMRMRSPLFQTVKKWWHDPSGKQQAIEMGVSGVKNMLRARRRFASGKTWIMARIEAVTALLLGRAKDGGPLLRISPKCVNTIREFESRQWKRYKVEGEDGRVRVMDRKGKEADRNAGEEPVPGNDHATDALEYVIYSELVSGRYKIATQEAEEPLNVSSEDYMAAMAPEMRGLNEHLMASMKDHAVAIRKPKKGESWSWGPTWGM